MTDMNAWIRDRAGYTEPDPEPVEEHVPSFNGGPRRTPPAPASMNTLLRRAAERRWHG
ncbi:hypothetical protein [Streptosporangium pseudovulgare]|uniref:Uncharacterized protein n=1 Tax=Streptosporangium pseudovulgare TaxID=35765 RepID=A0ABQ2RCZ0_9ACTN|nr:hypothetical protein [Streptosporangium pseudovulgare]GGQ20765.1 hypothetical protein GCM10010140_58790 [Streptosporangium pseudovulgare]